MEMKCSSTFTESIRTILPANAIICSSGSASSYEQVGKHGVATHGVLCISRLNIHYMVLPMRKTFVKPFLEILRLQLEELYAAISSASTCIYMSASRSILTATSYQRGIIFADIDLVHSEEMTFQVQSYTLSFSYPQ